MVDSGAASCTIAAEYFGLACDYSQLRHRYSAQGKPFSVAEVLRALRGLGLKARLIKSNWKRLERVAMPALVLARDGTFAVIGKVADGRALVQDPSQEAPQVVEREAFEEAWSGRLVLVTRRASPTFAEVRFGIGWFIPALARYKSLLSEVLVVSFFIQLLALISPLFFQVVIDKVLVHRSLSTLDVLAIGLLLVGIFEALLGALRTYVFSHTANRVDVSLGVKLFDHLLALPMSYFASRRVGDSVARVRELENIRNFLTSSALTLVLDLFFTIVFIAVMTLYSVKLTLLVLASLPIYVLISVLVTPVLRRRLDELFDRGAENQAFLVETVTGIETVKAMAVEPQMRGRFEDKLAAYVSASFKAHNLGNWAGQAVQLVSKLTTVGILWMGAHMAISGEITIGMLVAFNMLASQVTAPVLRLAQLWQEFQQARISILRLGDILNSPAEGSANGTQLTLPHMGGDIRFERVGFRYKPESPKVLDDLDLHIRSGECVGIRGASGSGKSTISKLIQRLYLPDGGRVLIDGIDVSQLDPAWLRRQIGVVLQENLLFNRTIRENIALIDPAMPMEQVIEAAKLAGAHDFILKLSHGYDTLVEERGMSLSGGQRQRIAIARALATNPKILIFDEATSALDYESEAAIMANMEEICADRTVIVIAHRESALERCERYVDLTATPMLEA